MQIAVIHPGALGDLLLALPLVQSLAEQGGPVTLFAAGGRAEFLAGRSAVSAGRSLESPALTALFGDGGGRSAGTGQGGSGGRDEAWPLADFARVISGVPDERFNCNLAAALPGARVDRLEVRPAAIERSGLHASEFLHRQVFGADAEAPLPRVLPTGQDRARAAAAVPGSTLGRTGANWPPFGQDAQAGGPPGGRGRLKEQARPAEEGMTLLIHPGSGGRSKCWALDGFVAVGEQLAAAGWRVVFVLGEAEVERMRPADRDALAGRFTTLTGLSLGELSGLIASSDAWLGNDSGATQLAAATGAATVAVFGPTDPQVWGPRGPRVAIIRGEPSAGPDWGVRPGAVAERLVTISQRLI